MSTKEENQKRRFKFQEGERILCFHGPLIYEAKCLKTRKNDEGVCEYLIHYAGWSKNWDEWTTDLRMLKYNEQNLAKQRDLTRAYKDAKKIRCKAALAASSGTVVPTVGNASTSSSTSKSSDILTDDENSSTSIATEKSTKTTPNLPGETSESETVPSKKRKRSDPEVETEEQFLDKVEIKIKIPDELKPWLVDDWDLICRQRKLLILPSKTTVDDIIENYIKQKTTGKNNNSANKESAAVQTANSIKEYFNASLGSQLLYKYERIQYSEILEKFPEKPMSSIYGAAHLLRLFVILGSLIVYTRINEKTVQVLQTQLQDFLRYLLRNSSTLFNAQNYSHAF